MKVQTGLKDSYKALKTLVDNNIDLRKQQDEGLLVFATSFLCLVMLICAVLVK